MHIVEIKNICKLYNNFKLDNVSFSLEKGQITGFIGRNGAGKTTTIKSMLNLIHIDKGEISYFDLPLNANEKEIKNRIGYSTGSINWYCRKKIKDIINITKSFYQNFNEDAYKKYLKLFNLDENKTPLELSEGMKVKVNLLLALSHNAEILILDEPTSGLDPFSRDELLELFIKLKNDGIAIFFSTHIISDLEKCADNIIYISQGKIIASLSKEEFINTYSNDNETLEETFLRLERGENDA